MVVNQTQQPTPASHGQQHAQIASAVSPSNSPQQAMNELAYGANPAIQRKAVGAQLPGPDLNLTGMPDSLKTGIENLSGFAMDDVRVHYNSVKPAQLGAHAFAQGNQIHLGPGQEQHLPHEAWHVVQQKQGRVFANNAINEHAVNHDISLENEATNMGQRALQAQSFSGQLAAVSSPALNSNTIQCFGFMEYFTGKREEERAPDVEAQVNPEAEDYPLPENMSDARRLWAGWFDFAKLGAEMGWDFWEKDTEHSKARKNTQSAVGLGAQLAGLGALGFLGSSGLGIGLTVGGGLLGLLLGGLGSGLGEQYKDRPEGTPQKKISDAGQTVGKVSKFLPGVVTGALGGLTGLVTGTVGSVATTAAKGAKGAWSHLLNLYDVSDKDLEDNEKTPTTDNSSVFKKKAKGLGLLFSPLFRGIASGFVGQGEKDSAFEEIYAQMVAGDEESDATKLAAGIHALIGALAQTGLGLGAGALKTSKNLLDFVAGAIGPGPISSITGPFMLHQGLQAGNDSSETLENISEALTNTTNSTEVLREHQEIADILEDHNNSGSGWKTAGEIGGSLDQAGALSQVFSGVLNLPLSLINYFRAEKTNKTQRIIASDDARDQALTAFSNLVRGGFFAGADITKGQDASWTSRTLKLPELFGVKNLDKSSTDAKVAGGMSSGIYGLYHASKLVQAVFLYHKLNKLKQDMGSNARLNTLEDVGAPADNRLTATDRFIDYAANKKWSAILRNTLAIGGTVAGAFGGASIATAVGLGLGGYQFWHWISSKRNGGERNRYATWLVNQYIDPFKRNANIDDIAKVLLSKNIRNQIVEIAPNGGPAGDFSYGDHKKLREHAIAAVEESLTSW